MREYDDNKEVRLLGRRGNNNGKEGREGGRWEGGEEAEVNQDGSGGCREGWGGGGGGRRAVEWWETLTEAGGGWVAG